VAIIVIVVLSLTLIYSLVVFDIMVRYALEARKAKRDLEMLKNELNHLLPFENNLAINRITTYNVPPPNKMPNNHMQIKPYVYPLANLVALVYTIVNSLGLGYY